MAIATETQEFYSISDTEAQHMYVGGRRAAQWVGFFLPYLRPGYTVLDCGCGVGSITLDLAERANPGHVVGIDVDESQLAIARTKAAERGLPNVSFERGSVYKLHFADASFDAVLAHTLLIHLNDPLRALKEIRRVLKPGGVAAISDDDLAMTIYSPDHPLLQKAMDLWIKLIRHNGGNPHYSRHLRSLLLQAGFVKTAGYAVAADYYGTLAETRRLATVINRLFHDPDLVKIVTGQGWVTEAELAEIVDWIQRWGERPDAFFAIMYCAAVGWTR